MINWISAKPVLLILIAVSVVSEYASGQSVGIATSTITPNTKSILELRASDKGVLLPRMTTAERGTYTLSAALGAADVGMTIFNTTTNTYEYWVGNAWVTMGTSGEPDDDWTVSGSDQYSAVSGNVGIGATSAYSKLEVYDANGPTMTITKDGADASSIFFRNGTGGGANDGTSLGLNTAEHFELTNSISNKDMFFNVNVGGTPTDVLFLDGGTGGVGINNTAPDYELDVSGDIGVNNSLVHNGDDNTFISFTTDRIQLFAGSTSSSWIDMQNSATELAVNENGVNRDFRVEGGSDANLIFADGGLDMVGIGNNAPTTKLDVDGQIRMRTGAAAGYIPVSDANGVMTWTAATALNGDFIQNQTGSYQTASFQISGTGEMDGGLTVGAGITIDDNDINDGDVADGALAFGNGSGEGISSNRSGAGANQYGLDFYTNSQNRLAIDNDGLVGINNSNPGNPLHVVGLSALDFDVARFDGSSAFGAGLRLNSTAAGGRAWTMISTANSAGEGAGKLLFKDETGGNVRMTVENGGNVGIGTTIPAAKLDVAGTVALNDNQLRLRNGGDGNHYVGYLGGAVDGPKIQGASGIVFSTMIGTAQDVAFFKQDYAYFGFDPGSCCNGFEKVKVGRGRNGDGTVEIMNNGWGRIGGTNGLAFWANGNADVDDSPQMILAQAGNVGIGTTTPGAKLDVVGKTETDQLQVGNAGDTFSTMQAGTATLGGGSNVAVYTVNFNSAFASAPKVICTVRTQTGQSYNDTFAVTTKNINTNNFQVNIARVDGGGSAWGQNLLLDWMAIQ